MKKYNLLFYGLLLILLLLFVFLKYLCLLYKPEYKIAITLLLFAVYFCLVFLLKKNIKINLIIILLVGLIIRSLFLTIPLQNSAVMPIDIYGTAGYRSRGSILISIPLTVKNLNPFRIKSYTRG